MQWLQWMMAGIWSQVWHWGTGVGVILLLLAMAWFTTAVPLIGPLLTGARTHLLWAAFVVAVFLGGQSLGAHDQSRKDAARKVVIEHQVDAVVEKAKRTTKRDRWDRPEY